MQANWWLVLARCTQDDVPMGLFDSRARALAYARKVMPRQVLIRAAQCLGVEVSGLSAIGLLPFACVEGRGVPGSLELVRSFHEHELEPEGVSG